MLNNAIIKKLTSVFEDYSNIEAVYLFGSYASQKNTANSDIDLGIIASDPSLEHQITALYAAMVGQGLDNIDLVFFNSADLVLQFEIIHHNKLIYRKEGFNHGELFSKTIRKYFDFKPYLNRQRKILKQRILHG